MKVESELCEVAAESARIGGRVLQEWRAKFTAREKSPKNLVTEADLASQHAILEFILARYPDHQFLGEEDLCRTGSAPYRWIIDPLDGTSNYVHGFPYYAVSVGVEHDGELVAGAVFDPNRDELFSAARGCGATRNGGERIEVSSPRELSQALCMASLPMQASRSDMQVQQFLKLLEAAQHVQRTGSAALNLCGVACGRIDAFWSTSLMPWDMAAGVLLVREAGGQVTTTDSGVFDVNVPDLLATNGAPLHGSVAAILR